MWVAKRSVNRLRADGAASKQNSVVFVLKQTKICAVCVWTLTSKKGKRDIISFYSVFIYLFESFEGTERCDSVALNEDITPGEDLDRLQRCSIRSYNNNNNNMYNSLIWINQMKHFGTMEEPNPLWGSVLTHKSLAASYKSLFLANHSTYFDNITGDIIFEDANGLFERDASCHQFDHIPSFNNHVRIPHLSGGGRGTALGKDFVWRKFSYAVVV